MKNKIILLLVLALCGPSALFALEGEAYAFRYCGGDNAKSVFLAGDFNDWSEQANPMQRDQEGCWETVIFLTYGRHEYRFVVDGETWERDPLNPAFGGAYSNSVLYLPPPETPTLSGFLPKSGQRLLNNSVVIRADYEPGIYFDPPDTAFSKILLDGESLAFQFDSTRNIFNAVARVADGEHRVTFFIQDTSGRKAAPDSLFFIVNANDSLPVAHAGFTRISAVGEPVTLSGGLSYDPDKDPIQSYAWKLLESPQNSTVFFENAHAVNPVFTPPLPGRYLFSLKIQAFGKWSARDTVDVIVLPLHKPLTRFTYTTPDTEIVTAIHLVGEFNQWKLDDSYRFEKKGDLWWLDIALPPGEYEYKIVLNETDWIPDPFNSKKVSDGWNGFNSLISVPPVKIAPPDVRLMRGSGRRRLLATASVGRIHWYGDIRNPVSLPLPSQNFLDLPPNMPKGHYTFFALSEQNGAYSAPRVMHLTVNSTGMRIQDANQVPGWAENAVIYEVYLRQFTPNGTIAALRKKLPYLQQLGVNCIWLMPIFESPQEHGYGPVNFFQIDSEYGTLREFKQLIQAAHQLDMKIMLDFIANHSADQHRYFLSAYTNPQSVFRDWYQWHSHSLLPDKLSYAYHNDWDSLPNLNYDNPNVWHFMIAVARHWAAMGVDGFRCDVAWGVPHLFWKAFRREIKREYPELLLLNEVLPRSPDYHDFEFDMSYDTDFYGNLLDVMEGRKPVSAIELGLRKSVKNYPPGALSLRYLENHDLDRFIATNDYLKTKLAATLLLTVPGTPLIYYGQELGLREIRGAMPWESSENGLFRFYERMLNLRRQNPALQGGEWLPVDSGVSDVLAYVRQKDDQRILLLFNFSDETEHILLDSSQLIGEPDSEFWLKPVFLGEPVPVFADEPVEVSLYGFEARIFEMMKAEDVLHDNR